MGSRESSSVTAACPVVSLLSQDDAWLQIHGPSKSKIQTRLSGRAPSDCSKGGRSFLHTGRCIRWAEREDQCIRCISRRLSASLWCWQTTRRYAIFTLFCPPKRGTRAFAWPYRIALEKSAPARSWSSFAGARGGHLLARACSVFRPNHTRRWSRGACRAPRSPQPPANEPLWCRPFPGATARGVRGRRST